MVNPPGEIVQRGTQRGHDYGHTPAARTPQTRRAECPVGQGADTAAARTPQTRRAESVRSDTGKTLTTKYGSTEQSSWRLDKWTNTGHKALSFDNTERGIAVCSVAAMVARSPVSDGPTAPPCDKPRAVAKRAVQTLLFVHIADERSVVDPSPLASCAKRAITHTAFLFL